MKFSGSTVYGAGKSDLVLTGRLSLEHSTATKN